MSWIELDEVKTYLNIKSPEQDSRLILLANLACKLIETYCGREFVSNNYIEYYDGGKPSVFVKNLPINSINNVSEYNGIDYITLVGPNSDGSLPNVTSSANVLAYVWYAETGEISRQVTKAIPDMKINNPYIFKNYPKGIKISYNGGYDSIPEDLKLAACDFIKILHKDIQQEQIIFQGNRMTQFPNSANFPPHVRRVLELYRVIM